MKKSIILILFLGMICLASGLKAQIYNNNNLYYQDLYLINPAASNLDDEFQAGIISNFVNAGYEGAPTRVSLMVSGPFSDKVGVGLRLFNDSRGAFRTNNLVASYAYKIRLSEQDHSLSMGLSAGMYWQNFQVSQINAVQMDDPTLLNADDYNRRHFVNEFGLLYQWKKLMVGFSAPYVVQLYNHYMAHASYTYEFPTVEGFALTPMVLYQYLPEKKSQVDGSLKFSYKPVWAAFTYRSNNNLLTAVGINYQKFELSYNYEINNKELSILSGSTHDIMLKYRFNLSFKSKSASYDKEKMPWQEK